MSSIAKDVTDADFALAVIERSKQIPVVVDLWAPWCGPCRQLTPILERIAQKRQGEFEFVKINVDQNPEVATALGARSIPLVVGFRDGVVAAKFMGLQPEAAVNKFINTLVPTEADRLVAAAAATDDPAAKEAALTKALGIDQNHEQAALALSQFQAGARRFKDAISTLVRLRSKGNVEAVRLSAEYQLKDAADVDVPLLEARVAAAPDDLAAAISLGKAMAAGGEYRRALELLLGAVARDPRFDNGAARQAVLDIFKVLGPADPLTRDYRARLAAALF